jgi:hypothetical protein
MPSGASEAAADAPAAIIAVIAISLLFMVIRDMSFLKYAQI